MQNHDHSVEGDLANVNSAQTVLYFFLLMLYKNSHVKYFDCAVVVFFHNFYSLKISFCFLFSLFINLQVEHTLDKCYNEPEINYKKET